VLLGEDEVLLVTLEVGLQDICGGGHDATAPPRIVRGAGRLEQGGRKVNSGNAYFLVSGCWLLVASC
jgi:hypothetical protein